VYKTLYNQFNQYLGHDTNIVDSIESTDKVGVQPGAVYEATSYEKQKNAEQFLARNVLPRLCG
jgi:hypothetical protein